MTNVTQTSSAQLGPGGHWRNWVGNQSFIARHKAEPGSEDELAALVREASRQNLSIRVAGSGHSFTPIVATSGLLLSLTNMQGLVSADLDRKRVVVRAGTRIGDIGRALKEIGLSLANQGDIDTQAIAGALSTGTHGTGIGLGCLSSQAVGMRLVQPDGSVLDLDADQDPETMAAAQVSIGMLGVISTITLQAVSAYNLKERLWRDDFESCMERHDDLAANNRHFSFFWCPVAESRHLYCLPDVAAVSAVKREHDVCEMKVMNLTDEPPYSNEKTVRAGRLQFGNLSDRIRPELPRTRIRHPRRERQGGLAANSRADADQAHELHLSGGISFRRWRFGHAEPLLPARQRDGLRLRRPGDRLLDAISSTSTRSSGNTERDRIGASCISIARKTCRRSIRAFMTSRRSAAKWTRQAAS